jgi:hypothetical protein
MSSAPSEFVFQSELAQGYLRVNNKGRRNLRCFPHCRPKGHVKSGFCGAPLDFKLNSLPAVANGNVERVLTWGEFTSTVSPPRFSPGDIVSEDKLEEEEKRYVELRFAFVEFLYSISCRNLLQFGLYISDCCAFN